MENKKSFFKENISYVLIIILVIFVKTYIVTPVIVRGDSMKDNLHNKDVMILDKISMRFTDIKRFDIVVIKTERNIIIKRVIGLPGEIIEYKNNNLYINGKIVIDKYNNGKTPDVKAVKLKDDEYFVLGDNRGISYDSSEMRPIKKSRIQRKSSLTIFPFTRFGLK